MRRGLSSRGAARYGALPSTLVLVLLAAACGDDGAPECLAPLELECSPDPEPPSYDNIFDDILNKSCGATGASSGVCHGQNGLGGLVLAGREEAYDSLLGMDDRHAAVLVEDPECSILVQRLESTDPDFRMPRGGDALTERQRCAVRQWIAKGAKRHED